MRFHSLFFLFPLLALMTLAAPRSVSADITTSLVGHWKFDNDTLDSSGQGNNGTAQGGPTYTTGKINQAISFDGVDDYVNAGSHASTELGVDHTITAWVYMTGNGFYSGIVTRASAHDIGTSKYALYTFGTDRRLSYKKGSPVETLSSLIIPLNQWAFVAVVVSNNNITFYINNNQVSTGTVGTPSYSTEPLRIGAFTDSPNTGNWPGLLDDVRIYNRALSASDIQELYNYTGPDTTSPTVSVTAPTEGTTVADTVPFSANASDNVGVTQVEFFVDGASKGTDTLSPYSINWDTTNGGTHACLGTHTHSLTARALDAAGNTTTSSAVVVNMNNPSYCTDTTPPILSNPSGGSLPAGTTQTTLSLNSNENATCRYSTIAGTPYASMPVTFSTTGGMSHLHTVTGLQNGQSYAFHVRCQDAAGNANTTDYSLTYTVASGASVDITTGLISHYTFDNTANDSVGNNHGTLVNSPTYTTGKIGQALQLNGTNQYASAPDSNSLDLTSTFTLSAWVNPAVANTDFRSILVKNYTYYLYGTVSGYCGNGGTLGGFSGGDDVCHATALPVNTWTHLTLTYNGASLTLYKNGTQVATQAASGSAQNTTGTLQIGASQWGEYFNGKLDDVRIYNRALAQQDIDSLYALGGSTPAPTVSISASPMSITSGNSSTLTWSSTNATSCTASGGWSGTKSTSGSQSISPTVTTTYTLSCTGAGGTRQNSTTVTVASGSGTTYYVATNGSDSNSWVAYPMVADIVPRLLSIRLRRVTQPVIRSRTGFSTSR